MKDLWKGNKGNLRIGKGFAICRGGGRGPLGGKRRSNALVNNENQISKAAGVII